MDISEAIPDVVRARRRELGLSQAELARATGVSLRQLARYEGGEQEPSFSAALALADALQISVTELAGRGAPGVNITGEWWASWQTYREGVEKIATQPVQFRQEAERVYIHSTRRGLSVDEGGYMWNGELRLWDNEILTGWYAASDGSIRSKGTMYLVMHPHGLYMRGRWVGLGYDDTIMTGWATMAKTAEDSEAAMALLTDEGGADR